MTALAETTYELGDGTFALLNSRHLEVLAALVDGGPTDPASVARRLGLSTSYTKSLLADLRFELGAATTTEMVVAAIRAGVVTP